jgi:GDP-L-fucose synthase
MNKQSKIYITNHEGLIGSALINKLKDNEYKNIICFKNEELNLLDKNEVDIAFKLSKPNYVFLIDSVNGAYVDNKKGGECFYKNLVVQTNVIEAARKYGVKKLLFLTDACVYPKDSLVPVKEEYLMSGPLEISKSSYAIAKLAGIEMCKSYCKQYNVNFISAVPCYVYGENDDFSLDSRALPSFIHKFYDAKINSHPQAEFWINESIKREFMHVDDLADALLFLMKNYNNSNHINIGVGYDVMISFLAKMIKDIVEYNGDIVWNKSYQYPNNLNQKLLDSSKLKSLGWEPKINLEQGIKKTFKWFVNNYNVL